MAFAYDSETAGHNHVLWYRPLSGEGRGFLFPCDADGRVNLDALNDQAKNNYLFARTAKGREFATPAVRRREDIPEIGSR